MNYKLFLDDVRNPVHCMPYMHLRMGRRNSIYLENNWLICRNFEAFKNTIEEHGLPEFISFDHDLATEHYYMTRDDFDYHTEDIEKTGYDCAKWLIDYCVEKKLKLPEFVVHSMNPMGTERIISVLNNAKKWL